MTVAPSASPYSTKTKPFKVSVSQVQTFRTCQTQWYYQSVLGLVKAAQAPRMDLGTWLHAYLEGYYKAISVNTRPLDAHLTSLKTVYFKAKEQAEELAATAYMMGDEAVANDYHSLSDKFRRLALGYYRVRGKLDPDLHEILKVEVQLPVELDPSLLSDGYIDLITRDRRTGNVYIWEHKSHKKIPSEGYRVRNVQVAVYASFLERVHGITPTHVLWNYICTEEPVIPTVLKSGNGLSRAQIHTTWDVYQQTLLYYGFDPKDYIEQQIALSGRETSMFYPRFHMDLAGGQSLILRDYEQTARDMQVTKALWEGGHTSPVRSISSNCDYCQFVPLCDHALLTGEEANPFDRGFTKRPPRSKD